MYNTFYFVFHYDHGCLLIHSLMCSFCCVLAVSSSRLCCNVVVDDVCKRTRIQEVHSVTWILPNFNEQLHENSMAPHWTEAEDLLWLKKMSNLSMCQFSSIRALYDVRSEDFKRFMFKEIVIALITISYILLGKCQNISQSSVTYLVTLFDFVNISR